MNQATPDVIRIKPKKTSKTRRGGYKPPRIAPQPTQSRQRTKKYRKIPMIPKELQSATHSHLPKSATNIAPKTTDKQDKTEIDSDLLD